jgi:hypothetical protein
MPCFPKHPCDNYYVSKNGFFVCAGFTVGNVLRLVTWVFYGGAVFSKAQRAVAERPIQHLPADLIFPRVPHADGSHVVVRHAVLEKLAKLLDYDLSFPTMPQLQLQQQEPARKLDKFI